MGGKLHYLTFLSLSPSEITPKHRQLIKLFQYIISYYKNIYSIIHFFLDKYTEMF
jgi:hypothetical protein